MLDLTLLGWVALAVGALLVGFAKTAIGAVTGVSVALFAAVLPARESTGALLPLLLVGDLVAITVYRAHVEWGRLVRLLPAVAVGLLAGVVFLGRVDDTVLRRTIGVVLLALVGVSLLRRWGSSREVLPTTRAATASYGALAGFTTMVANAGSAVMALYLLGARLDKLRYLGTTAWFFFLVNVVKLPFSAGLGLVQPASLRADALLAVLVLLGAWVGRLVIARLDQARFETAVLGCTVLSSLPLLR